MQKLKKAGLSLTLLLVTANSFAITAEKLRCEYLIDPMGIDARSPRLSWVLGADRRAEKQTAYQIMVASSKELLEANQPDLWDTGKTDSDETTQIAYGGKPLSSRQSCYWKVRSWDRDGKPGNWSKMAGWQMGLLERSDWSADWIDPEPETKGATNVLQIQRATYGDLPDGAATNVTAIIAGKVHDGQLDLTINNTTLGGDPADGIRKRLIVEYILNGHVGTIEVSENETLTLPRQVHPLRYVRKSFALNAPVKRAVLYVTALGLYEMHLNGQRVGDHVLAPDWTDYRKRVRYQAYDVTAMLNAGDNALAGLIAPGWYSGKIGNGAKQFFGTKPALLAQLEVTFANGRTETIATDASWKSHASPVLSSDFMLGESYDARREVEGWDQPRLDEREWEPVSVREESALELDGQVMEPVRKICELHPKSVSEPKPGLWTFDLGQNMVGVVRLKVSAPAGTTITLRHAERLNPDGTIYTTNLRGAPSVDHYMSKGGGVEIWQPKFTFHGFQYVEVSGLDSKPDLDTITGIVIASDTAPAGEFVCSDPRINQLQSNIVWGQRGNYLSVPTDCPQRDERLGWMGDAQVFIRTASYNADIAAFFKKWLVDVDDGQSPEGSFSDVNPNTMGCGSVPAWGDAGVICPWTIYEVYGDKRILERHLPAMTKWIEYLREHSTQLIRDKDRGNDYGDWLSIGANTPKDLIGTAYFAYSTHLVAKSYRALGREAEANKYEKLFEDIKAAFNKRYVSTDGRIEGNTQCGYAMALKFELLPKELRAKAANYLVEDIKAKGNHLSTGFVGVSYLLPVLSAAGKTATAYDLLLQDTFPSWLFSVKHGATTIWERWDGWTPEKGFQDPGMNSFNHYSLGSCGEFLFGGVAGIQPASPGYKEILIAPVIHDGLSWAQASYDSIHGKIESKWKRNAGKVSLDITIPPNTTAKVLIPTDKAANVSESGVVARRAKGVKFLSERDGQCLFEVGSGTYHFVATAAP